MTPELANTMSMISRAKQNYEDKKPTPQDSFVDVSKLDPSRPTVVMDMDETMIKAFTEADEEFYDVKPPKYMELNLRMILNYKSKGTKHGVKVIFRPYLFDILDFLSLEYNLVVYTAGMQEYAEPIIDAIEAETKYFQARLYRQHCTKVNGQYLKDLKLIAKDGISLEKMVLLDNSMFCFSLNLNNGIPIPDFTGLEEDEENEDQELVFASQFIENLFKS